MLVSLSSRPAQSRSRAPDWQPQNFRVPETLVTPELTSRGKPYPDPFLLGAELLGVAVGECVVLEDAPSGVASGRAAGMKVIAVLTTHGKEDLPGAAAYIADLTQLSTALDSLGVVWST